MNLPKPFNLVCAFILISETRNTGTPENLHKKKKKQSEVVRKSNQLHKGRFDVVGSADPEKKKQ